MGQFDSRRVNIDQITGSKTPGAEQTASQQQCEQIEVPKDSWNPDSLYERSFELAWRLKGTHDYGYDVFRGGLTGHHNGVGKSTYYNTLGAAEQLMLLISMSSDPLIDDFIKKNPSDITNKERQDFVEALRKAQILKGFKVLDLGCGPIPSFARVARALGATVWTVDKIVADKFERIGDMPGYTNPEHVTLENEKRFHIVQDLMTRDAVANIAGTIGDKMDLVTQSFIRADGCYFRLENEDTSALIRVGGGYFISEGFREKIKING